MPNLIRRLIRELVPTVTQLSMPGDEDTDLNGYDGMVTSPIQTPFVPQGKSVWEFGTSGRPGDKAERDYSSRTRDPLGVDRSNTTFVFVTPLRWAGADKWAREKNDLREWKHVAVRTSADIFAALEACLPAHVWFSEEIGKPANGVMTLDLWWQKFVARTDGLLTPQLLTVGREQQVRQLLTRFAADERGHTWIRATSTDDVLGFVAASILIAEGEERENFLERALVVFEPGALIHLDRSSGLLILVPFDESLVRQADLATNNHVVLHTTQPGIAMMELQPISIALASSLLAETGVAEGRVPELSRAINKSVASFKFRISGQPNADIANELAAHSLSPLYRRAWLLGAWNSRVPADLQAFELLVGNSYAESTAELERLASGISPVLVHVEQSWRVSNLAETVIAVGSTLTNADFQSLETVIQDVFGEIDPLLDVPREDRWRAGLDGTRREHSQDLRRGLARTLAAFGASESSYPAASGVSFRGWSELAVRALLLRANEDETGRLWQSLVDVIALLAEAAPDVYLAALEHAISHHVEFRASLFSDVEDGIFTSTSPHTYVLWSLEVLAWSPNFFGAAASSLSALAEIDPGGRSSNRPLESLVNVFRPWRPQTGATLTSRQAVLRRVTSADRTSDWSLLIGLLPNSNDFMVMNVGPEFHSWKTDASETQIPMASYIEFVTTVVEMTIARLSDHAGRFVDLVAKLEGLTPELRSRVTAAIGAAAMKLDGNGSTQLWVALTALIRRHREYPEAEWSLKGAELDSLAQLAASLTVDDAGAKVAWLFEEVPDLNYVSAADDFGAYQDELTRLRIEAVEGLVEQGGLDAVLRLADEVENPWSLGYAAAVSSVVHFDLNLVAQLLVADLPQRQRFASTYLSNSISTETNAVVKLATSQASYLAAARVLQAAEDLPAAWRAASDLGDNVEKAYWSEFSGRGRGRFNLVNESAELLASHGRLAAALDLLALYLHDKDVIVDPALAFTLMTAFTSNAAPDPRTGALSEYQIRKLLGLVQGSDTYSTDELALLEWKLLPGLGHDTDVLSLQVLLASSPEFFETMITSLYKSEVTDAESVDVVPGVALNAWNLLRRWKVIPGSSEPDGEVSEIALHAWVKDVRARLQPAGRLRSGESHIGQVFAHSKSDEDGTWPTQAVRDFLEASSSASIDKGFVDGVLNTRGVTTRSMVEGGAQERALVAVYNAYAAAVVDEWPRTARLLRQVSAAYLSEAKRNDDEAQRFQEGFDF